MIWRRLTLLFVLLAPLAAVHADQHRDKLLIDLGRKLFYDTRLSGDGSTACIHCHNLRAGGADPRGVSIGMSRVPLHRNAPSVYNAVFNFRQTWDGRARTLEDQARMVLKNPDEMGVKWGQTLQQFRVDETISPLFQQLFGGITLDGAVLALAAFEKTLVTLDSPYDRYMGGDLEALNEEQQEGLKLFRSLGCNSCHDGPHLGGNQFQKIALFFEAGGSDDDLITAGGQVMFWDGESSYGGNEVEEDDHNQELKDIAVKDTGRYRVTGRKEDYLVFKVPNLRNVALTPPYFHDGSASTLELAIFEMAEHQLGILLSDFQIDQLVAFLQSLTSESLKRGQGPQ